MFSLLIINAAQNLNTGIIKCLILAKNKTAKDLIPQSCIKSAVLWQMAFWHSGKRECLLPPCILNSNYIEL